MHVFMRKHVRMVLILFVSTCIASYLLCKNRSYRASITHILLKTCDTKPINSRASIKAIEQI